MNKREEWDDTDVCECATGHDIVQSEEDLDYCRTETETQEKIRETLFLL